LTCIVGLEAEGRVVVGADSLVAHGNLHFRRSGGKLFKNGGLIMGASGSARLGQLLHYSLKVPPIPERGLERWLATTFMEAVRECLGEGGFRKVDSEQEGLNTSSFVLGIRDRLYRVDSDFQLNRTGGYLAMGSGQQVAMGALHALQGSPGSPRARVRRALVAAAAHVTTVRGPFSIYQT
jgi:ATP-dependent protease HslVU (ClpYQ) peptidase subunit